MSTSYANTALGPYHHAARWITRSENAFINFTRLFHHAWKEFLGNSSIPLVEASEESDEDLDEDDEDEDAAILREAKKVVCARELATYQRIWNVLEARITSLEDDLSGFKNATQNMERLAAYVLRRTVSWRL
ncbi:hypothetical protein BC834DRAFT_972688 [Gloeopeniophorella convolvens]|nr:hypothetical protein BC834DRAFT_972688 [Gloeopeniophorella convolvens]